MKRVLNGLGGALCAAALLATIGCDHIRDYSVNSYQGVLPVGDFRPTGSITSTTLQMPESPRPSIPTQPPEAAPAASAPSSDTTQPADSSK